MKYKVMKLNCYKTVWSIHHNGLASTFLWAWSHNMERSITKCHDISLHSGWVSAWQTISIMFSFGNETTMNTQGIFQPQPELWNVMAISCEFKCLQWHSSDMMIICSYRCTWGGVEELGRGRGDKGHILLPQYFKRGKWGTQPDSSESSW